MKLSSALYFVAFSSCAIAAPISGVSGRADLSNFGQRQEPRMRSPIKVPINLPSTPSEKNGSKTQGIQPSSSQHQLSSSGVAKPSPKKTSHKSKKPKPSSYLASLAHRLSSKSPFSDSSIVREETRASRGDWESEATIVESETKASREATLWLPCFSTDKTLHYHRIRVNTDTLAVSIVLIFIAVVLVIELWRPVTARIRRFRSSHGPIYLSVEGVGKEDPARDARLLCGSTVREISDSKREAEKTELVTTR
ncbi:hypothetical protein F5B22DRAFT_643293 [Xylaria bambusicola]|uniref:uncharacterized protein n=1 Tax=Xylaria bambusicola TaxID=326684 RepID=UPI002008A046|nr:uncharacterized protein F5B22DRAFT_643293 [Xylaria bambusicola]KAI0522273.1 hypothetical protein F5B22DRAFT_643293 [Xylaria bambusicola]